MTPRTTLITGAVLAAAGTIALTASLALSTGTLTQPTAAPAPQSAPPVTPVAESLVEPTVEPELTPGKPCLLEIFEAHGDPSQEAAAFHVQGDGEAWGLAAGTITPVCTGMTSLADLTLTAPQGPGALGELQGGIAADAASSFTFRSETGFVTVIAILDEGELLLSASKLPVPVE